jgi:hypothetical protein
LKGGLQSVGGGVGGGDGVGDGDTGREEASGGVGGVEGCEAAGVREGSDGSDLDGAPVGGWVGGWVMGEKQ